MHRIIPKYNEVFYLNSNSETGSSFLALGKSSEFVLNEREPGALDTFQRWLGEENSWVFGGISYDIKNLVENLHSNLPDTHGFPLLHFVRPQIVLKRRGNAVELVKNDSELEDGILLGMSWDLGSASDHPTSFPAELKPLTMKDEYLAAVRTLQQRIHAGDIYEINYCQEFGTVHPLLHPFDTWCRLNALTLAPMSCFVKLNEHYVMCASPERFLQKRGNAVISQPIKGTIRRGTTEQEDESLREMLRNSKKDRSENVMIVDLVRNDLSHHAIDHSVEVTELFGVHTFPTVHHMISTVRAKMPANITFTQLLKDTFPMGSMTGAPKISAMQLIEKTEKVRRGWYSGAIGYIAPNGDFDFNVVIRSLFYNATTHYLSCQAGGAITALSHPEDEYNESMLKAQAMMNALR